MLAVHCSEKKVMEIWMPGFDLNLCKYMKRF